MKIKAKLVLLVLAIVLMLAMAGGAYILLLNPVSAMERERGYLTSLHDALMNEQVQLGRLPYTAISQGGPSFRDSAERVQGAFADLAKIETLPKLNPEAAKSLETIGALKDLGDKRLAVMQGEYDALLGELEAVFHFVANINFINVYDYDFKSPERRARALASAPSLKRFMAAHAIMQSSLEAAREVVDEQYALIDGEISKARSRALAAASGIAALIVAITIAAAILFSRGIAGSVVSIERNIALLKEGDLRGRVEARSRDEIGTLAANLNVFLDSLSSALLRIKGTSRANLESKESLLEAVGEATRAAARIEASSESIAERIKSLDARIGESAESVDSIAGSIAELNEQIEGQGAMVEETTASVTEMLSSLEGMGRMTERNRASASELVRTAEKGRLILEEASAKIAEVPQSVGAIREMAAVIQGIASQTNLLAMNAAIEAAHAGEAGKGFAVVADEIRKLSEASTESSLLISGSIEKIVAAIGEAASSSSGTMGAFSEIDDKIREVSASMAEIHSGIGEMRVGGEQVLQAMAELQERSVKVREGSLSMESRSSMIGAAMRDLGLASKEISSNIAEIGSGMADIGGTMRSVGGMARRVGEESARLDDEINRFKTLA